MVIRDVPGSPSARLFASFTPVPGAVRALACAAHDSMHAGRHQVVDRCMAPQRLSVHAQHFQYATSRAEFAAVQRETYDILMFGGEYWDGKQDKMHVYNDLFLYSTAKGTWKQIISPQG